MRRSFLVSILLVTPFFCLWRWGGLDQIGSHTDRSSGYDRYQYGHWKDFDGDCQNTRHEILIESSDISIQFKTEKKCVVVSGAWYDPYTSKNFKKAKEIDIDHVVPLKEAHISGASGWTKEKKRQFANDEENLLAVSRSANRSKGAKDPAQWMPKNEAFHCEYIKKWVAVKEKYMLYMDRNEQQKINRLLAGC